MPKIMEIIEKETKGKSYHTYKYSYDSIGLSQHFILPRSHIFGGDLVDFAVFKVRQNFLLNNVLFGLPSAFL